MVRLDWAGWTRDGEMPDDHVATPFIVSETSPVSGELHFIDGQHETELEPAAPLRGKLFYNDASAGWVCCLEFPLNVDGESWGTGAYTMNREGPSGSVYS